MREKDWHRTLQPARRSGHESIAIPLGRTRLLGCRQRFVPPGLACTERLRKRWPNLIVVHTPVHASWLNQVEIYFSIAERKVLTPNDFNSLSHLEDALIQFQDYYALSARPFEWKFTRADLAKLLSRLELAKAA